MAVLLMAACSQADPAPPSAAQEVDPGLVHVHRLAVGPKEPDTVLIATHTGPFVSDDGGPPQLVEEPLPEGLQDHPARAFIASGHPDLRSDDLLIDGTPALLGLVESADRAAPANRSRCWARQTPTPLEARYGKVHAAESTSGRLMISSQVCDGRHDPPPDCSSWRSAPIDPDVIVGILGRAAPAQQRRGRTWEALPSSCDCARLGRRGAVCGTPDGLVQASTDAAERGSCAATSKARRKHCLPPTGFCWPPP